MAEFPEMNIPLQNRKKKHLETSHVYHPAKETTVTCPTLVQKREKSSAKSAAWGGDMLYM